jgi:hypothetical protein
MDISPHPQSSEFLSLAAISHAGVCKAVRRLKPCKSGRLDDSFGFIIKDY